MSVAMTVKPKRSMRNPTRAMNQSRKMPVTTIPIPNSNPKIPWVRRSALPVFTCEDTAPVEWSPKEGAITGSGWTSSRLELQTPQTSLFSELIAPQIGHFFIDNAALYRLDYGGESSDKLLTIN